MTDAGAARARIWKRLAQLGSVLVGVFGALFACAYPELGRSAGGRTQGTDRQVTQL